jgi:hypothetical protein
MERGELRIDGIYGVWDDSKAFTAYHSTGQWRTDSDTSTVADGLN